MHVLVQQSPSGTILAMKTITTDEAFDIESLEFGQSIWRTMNDDPALLLDRGPNWVQPS